MFLEVSGGLLASQFFSQTFCIERRERKAGRKSSPGRGERWELKFGKQREMTMRNKGRRPDRIFQN